MYSYLMAAICAVAGLMLIFQLGKEKKLYYPLGVFLILLGGWTLADKLTDGALSGSWAVWVQRAVLLVVIIVLCIVLAKDIRASKAAVESTEAEDDDDDTEDADQ